MFGLEMLERDYDMQSPEGKTAFFREAAKRLGEFEEEIERNNYIEAVAKTYRIGYEELKKLVQRTAVQSGLASMAVRPKAVTGKPKEKEDGYKKSQKVLLTWMLEGKNIFAQIKRYITPEDFSTELYKKVAALLYEQYQQGEVNPAKIMNQFTDEEEHREVASLFHTRLKEIKTKEEQEKALKETLLRVKSHSIEKSAQELEPTDLAGLQKLMNAKRELLSLKTLHISID